MTAPERSFSPRREEPAREPATDARERRDGRLDRSCAAIGFLLPLLAGGNFFVTFDPTTALSCFALAAVALLSAPWPTRRSAAPRNVGANAALMVFAVWWLANFLSRPIGPHAAMDSAAIFCGILLYAWSIRTGSIETAPDHFVIGLMLGATLTTFYAQYQYWIVFPRLQAWMPAHGLPPPFLYANANFYSANCYAAFLAAVIILGSGVAWNARVTLVRSATIAMLVPTSIALVLTKSRGAIALLALSFVAMWIARSGSSVRRFARTSIAFSTAIAGLAVVALLTTNVREFVWVSAGGRILIWRAALHMACDHWLTGVGVGRFGEMFPRYQLVDYYTRYPHNSLLEVFAELGVLGVASFIAFLVLRLRSLRLAASTQPSVESPGSSSSMRSFFTAATLLLLVHSLIDIDWKAPANPILLFLLLSVP